MKNTSDNPGVFIPPPLFYVTVFLSSIFLQRFFPIRSAFFHTWIARITGGVFILAGMICSAPALRQFIKTKNTVVTIKPATSLQTSGIYSVTRNPMYAGLFLVYLGMACLLGNWWTLLLIPVLIFLVIYLIILPEERYLLRAFGDGYSEYKKRVRRWI